MAETGGAVGSRFEADNQEEIDDFEYAIRIAYRDGSTDRVRPSAR